MFDNLGGSGYFCSFLFFSFLFTQREKERTIGEVRWAHHDHSWGFLNSLTSCDVAEPVMPLWDTHSPLNPKPHPEPAVETEGVCSVNFIHLFWHREKQFESYSKVSILREFLFPEIRNRIDIPLPNIIC